MVVVSAGADGSSLDSFLGVAASLSDNGATSYGAAAVDSGLVFSSIWRFSVAVVGG